MPVAMAKIVAAVKNATGVASHSRSLVRKRRDSTRRAPPNPIAIHPARTALVTLTPGNRSVHPAVTAARRHERPVDRLDRLEIVADPAGHDPALLYRVVRHDWWRPGRSAICPSFVRAS